jgi:ACS family glucarate transporter-like MFS transporter
MESVNDAPIKTAPVSDRLDQGQSGPVLSAAQKSKRNQILILVMLSVGLTYLARVNLSVAGHAVQQDMHFSTVTMGWVFSAFLLGYALLQVPSGWAADRFGPRRVVTVAVLVWAVFTALTGLAPALPLSRWMGLAAVFMAIRFMVGVGEAACFPAGNKLVANWMGSEARGWGASFNVIGVGLGGAVTPPLITWVLLRWGWRWSFYVCAEIGVIFALVWYLSVRNQPEEGLIPTGKDANQPGSDVPSQNRPIRQGAPWARLLKSPSVWGLILGYFCQGYPIYFYYTWIFIYLTRVRGLTLQQGGAWGMLPYLSIAILAPLGGLFSDFLSRRLGKRRGRQFAVWTGMFASALLLWLGSRAPDSITAVVLLAGASGSNMFAAPTFWATSIDLTPQFAGSLSGLMNMFGNLGGWLSPIVTAYLATRLGWPQALLVAALVTIASGLCFIFVDAGKCLDAAPSAGDFGNQVLRKTERIR